MNALFQQLGYWLSLSLIVCAGVVALIRLWQDAKTTGISEQGNLSTAPSPLRQFLWVLSAVVVSRLFIILVGYMAVMLFENTPYTGLAFFQNTFSLWDSPHYLSIAAHWYQTQGDESVFVVFLPLLPLGIKLFHFLISDWFLAGVVFSSVCLLASSWLLFALVRSEFGIEKAYIAVLFLLFGPFSFFLGLVYSESLFLLLSLGAWTLACKRHWWLAGLCGLLSSLTKIQGVLIVLPLFLEFLLQRKQSQTREKPHIANVLTFLLPFAGVGVYLLINKVIYGNPLHFLAVQQEHWSQHLGFLPSNISMQVDQALTSVPNMSVVLWWPQLIAFALAIVLIILVNAKLKSPLIFYSLAFIMVSYSATWLLSGCRYLDALFALPLAAAVFFGGKPRLQPLAFALSAGLLVFFTVAFIRGSFVM